MENATNCFFDQLQGQLKNLKERGENWVKKEGTSLVRFNKKKQFFNVFGCCSL